MIVIAIDGYCWLLTVFKGMSRNEVLFLVIDNEKLLILNSDSSDNGV